MAKQGTSSIAVRLRDRALGLAGVEEGIACEGTALEKRTLKVRNKAFLFLGKADMMLKLGPSLAEAEKAAKAEPDRYKVGATGWVTVQLGEALPAEQIGRWIEESHSLFASKKPSRKPAK